MTPPPPRIALLTDGSFDAHTAVGFHPERPERRSAAVRGAQRALGEHAMALGAREVTPDELARVHDPVYVALLEAALARGEGFLDGDTFFSAGSHRAAWLAAGAGCVLVEALLDGRCDAGMVLARPPGHHALPNRAMGFCLLNNIAIAAAHARTRGVSRVAIVDWDVHHGNGTQAIFARDPSVLFVSLHQWPLYPGTGAATETGAGDGVGATVNLPLPRGSGPSTYASAFERIVLPIVDEFRPELILVSAGYDAHERDPLASMRLTSESYGWMAARVASIARVGLFLEGGYDLAALEDSVDATLRAIHTGSSPALAAATDSSASERALHTAAAAQRAFWKGVG